MRKFLIGMAAIAIICALFGSGYRFGKYLAQNERASAAMEPR